MANMTVNQRNQFDASSSASRPPGVQVRDRAPLIAYTVLATRARRARSATPPSPDRRLGPGRSCSASSC